MGCGTGCTWVCIPALPEFLGVYQVVINLWSPFYFLSHGAEVITMNKADYGQSHSTVAQAEAGGSQVGGQPRESYGDPI